MVVVVAVAVAIAVVVVVVVVGLGLWAWTPRGTIGEFAARNKNNTFIFWARF